ncbi:MAG TPA: M23 family metallopeptidase [Bacteroidales bacterium]|nr:M23 family metallopeptidase [Bacteroidales bacterium]HPS27121.1 M23 family metallopeptidase [Bacteroidales bacterium]
MPLVKDHYYISTKKSFIPVGGKRLFFLILFLLNSTSFAFSQKIIPKNYFIPPLDIKPIVSGTFGELRPDHFHSGLDFATQNKTGFNVYCIADGYVSRIKVAAGGYGKVIYITHPNGYVSVYAHLGEFNVVVEDYVRRKQYEKKSFEIELFPNPSLFPFKKGDIVGYSGNSGSSSGAHLHFEIRSEITEHPINPRLFGYSIPDETCPGIFAVYLYPKSTGSSVDKRKQKVCLTVEKKGSSFQLARKDTLKVSGGISFGVESYDQQYSYGKNGIYSLEILIDSIPFYKISFDSIDFSDGRYINALIDYPEYVASRKRIIQTYISRGNRLNLYAYGDNRGIYFFTDTLLHTVTVIASDFNKNASSVSFPVRSVPPADTEPQTPESALPLFRFGLKNHFENKNIILELPATALYDSLYFEYDVKPRTTNTFSGIYQVHNPYTPLHAAATLMIKPDSIPGDTVFSKLTLARVNGNFFSYVKSKQTAGYLSAKIHQFGNYTIVADTTAPVIKPIGIPKDKKIISGATISFKITDNFSGIETYTLTINGEWVLAEFDLKNNLLTYKADPQHFLPGKNNLKLKVTDKLHNKTEYTSTLLF